MIDADDVELVRRAAGDDLAAFAVLVRKHEAPLRRFTRRLAGDEGDDIAQEALLAAWRALGQWRGEGSFAAWLRTIATRRYFDRLRRAGPNTAEGIEISFTAPDSKHDYRIAIDQALASLAPRERAAALLVFAEGHSHSEAATILGLPLGTLKSIVARARQALIPLLEGRMMTESDIDARLAQLFAEAAPNPDDSFADRIVRLASHDLAVRRTRRRSVERLGLETLTLCIMLAIFAVLARSGSSEAGFGDVVSVGSPAILGLSMLALWLVVAIRPANPGPRRGR